MSMTLCKQKRAPKGFTVVELTIVIAVIGILAAIVIIGYGPWQKNIRTNQVKSDLKSAISAMENARNFSNGYPASVTDVFTPSADVTLTGGGAADVFCIVGKSTKDAAISFRVSAKATDPREGTCQPPVVPEGVLNEIFYQWFMHWIFIPAEFDSSITSYEFSYRSFRADAWTPLTTPVVTDGWYGFDNQSELVQSYESNVVTGQLRIVAIGPDGKSEPVIIAYNSIQEG